MKTAAEPYTLPFTVLIDTNEGHPFVFKGHFADANQNYRPLYVPTARYNLGRFPLGLGDYSIQGFKDRVGIERKSIEDVWGTILGWETEYDKRRSNTGRRDRFEKELLNLSSIEFGLVVVEASLGQVLDQAPEYGVKSAAENRKTLHRSIISFQQRFKVPWSFCDTRELAEAHTLRHLMRFHREHKKEFKEKAKIPFI